MPVVITASTSGPRFRWNHKNKRVRIDPRRSTAMKIVTRHLKGRKRPASVVAKAAKALRLTLRKGVTKTGRRIARRKKA